MRLRAPDVCCRGRVLPADSHSDRRLLTRIRTSEEPERFRDRHEKLSHRGDTGMVAALDAPSSAHREAGKNSGLQFERHAWSFLLLSIESASICRDSVRRREEEMTRAVAMNASLLGAVDRRMAPSSSLTNSELASLYERFGHLVLRRCRTILRDEDLAQDALQDAFIKLFRFGARIREAESELRWIYRVADRCCFDLLKKRKAQPISVPDPAADHVLHPAPYLQARSAVMHFLHRLDELDRRIAVLFWVDGLNQGEIAAEVERSRQTVNKRLGAIRRRAKTGEQDG